VKTEEEGMQDMVTDLAKIWNTLLKNSDEALEIDGEYTRHGVMQLLNDFLEAVESSYRQGRCPQAALPQ